jgi:LacI family transcriptional regulator
MDLLSAVRRQEGFEDAFKAAKISLDPDLIVPGDFTSETGFEQGRKLLSLDEPPTAIFAANDQSAKGVFQAAESLNLRIPDDLSVVGYDDVPEAAYLDLTTVNQHINHMGYVGTQMLFTLIQGNELESPVHKVNTELVIRGSCKPV